MIRTVTGRLPGDEAPKVSGTISIPASKSHTIRALLIAAFATGESRLRRPLLSRDSISCRQAVEALGAKVTDDGPDWVVQGFGSRPKPPGMPSSNSASRPILPPVTIDVGNSGTTLYLAAALAALSETPVRFDGDQQIRRRSATPLLAAGGTASNLGRPASAVGSASTDGNALSPECSDNASVPLGGGNALNLSASEVTTIRINTLNEAPYVGITLDWLDSAGIRYEIVGNFLPGGHSGNRGYFDSGRSGLQ